MAKASINLTEAQWKVVLHVLGQNPMKSDRRQKSDPRQIFASLLRRAVYGGSYVDDQGQRRDYLQVRAEAWIRSGELGMALELLHQHFKAATGYRHSALRDWALSSVDDDWRCQTARLLLTDGMISLTRLVNRNLHKKLVMALMVPIVTQ